MVTRIGRFARRDNRTSPARRRILVYFLLGHLILIAIPFSIAAVLHIRAVDLMRTEVVNGNLRRLQSTRDLLDNRLAEVEAIARKMRVDPLIRQYRNAVDPFAPETISMTLDLRTRLYDYGIANRFIARYFVLFHGAGVALGPNLTYRLVDLRRLQLNPIGMNEEEWQSTFVNTIHYRNSMPAVEIAAHDRTGIFVVYLDSIGHSLERLATIVILIEAKEIESLLSQVWSGQGAAYVEDRHGRVISGITSESTDSWRVDTASIPSDTVTEVSAGTETLLVAHTTSAHNRWRIVAVQPTAAVLHSVYRARSFGFFGIVVSLLLGVFIAYRLASHNASPLTALFDRAGALPDAEGGWAVSKEIASRLTFLIESRDHLKRELDYDRPLLRRLFLDRLLSGEFVDHDDIASTGDHVGVSLTGAAHTVATVQITRTDDDPLPIDDLSAYRVGLRRLIRLQFGESIDTHDRTDGNLVIIVQSDAPRHRCFERLVEGAAMRLGIQIRVGVGLPYADAVDIHRSFEESRIALASTGDDYSHGVVYYRDIRETRTSYDFPPEVEAHVLSLMRADREQQLLSTLDQIWESNRLHNPPVMQNILAYDLWGTLAKFQSQTTVPLCEDGRELDFWMVSTDAATDLEGMYGRLRDGFRRACIAVRSQRSVKKRRVIETALDYVDSHCLDPQLGVSDVARHLKVSEAYLTHAFKELMGTPVYGYVERQRINHARCLLASTSLPIRAIAEQSGYNSMNTFCKAFRRNTGTSASAYRRAARAGTSTVAR